MKHFLLLLFACLSFPAFAQQLEVRDAATQESLPGAVVLLKNAGTAQLRHGVTGKDGRCIFQSCDTIQVLELRMPGYARFRDTLPAGCTAKKCLLRLSPDSLNEVVVTAQYESTAAADAVQQVRIINRARIDAQGAQNLHDLLANEMNIRQSQDAVLGSSMGMQGLSGENVRIMIDGVPVIGRQNGNIDLSQILLSNVERVEIIEGPQSVNYGSNALAGVVNLVTARRQEHALIFGTDNFYESSGQYNALLHAGLQHQRTILLLSAGRNYFDGWSDGDPAFLYEKRKIADSSRVRDWKPREQYFGTVQLIHHLDRGQCAFSSDLFREKITNRGMPRAPYEETAFDDYYRTFRSGSTFSTQLWLNETHQLQVQVAYNYYRRTKNTWYKNLSTLEQQLAGDNSLQDTTAAALYMLRASYLQSGDSVRLHYEAGIDFEYETANGIRIANRARAIGDYALFASAEYKPWQRLALRPGLRWSYNTAYKNRPSPSLNTLLQLGKNWKLRASYARGFRAPVIKELYFYFVDINHNIRGNENLLAEHSNNFMAALSWNKTLGGKNYKLNFSGFYNAVSNLITLALISGTEYSYINIGQARTAGTAAGFDFQVARLQVAISFGYTARSNESANGSFNTAYSWSPESNFSLMWEQKKSKLWFAAFAKYNGRLPQFVLNEQGQVSESFTGDYTLFDGSVSRRFWKEKLLVEAGCRNLLDVRTVPSAADSGVAHSPGNGSMLVANGRNYFFRVQLRLDFDKKTKE